MVRNVLVGLGAAAAGFVISMVAGMVLTVAQTPKNATGGEERTVSFSLIGIIHHFWWFWWLVLALGAAGFLFSYWRTRA